MAFASIVPSGISALTTTEAEGGCLARRNVPSSPITMWTRAALTPRSNIVADFRGCGLGLLEDFAIKHDRGLHPHPAAFRPGKICDNSRQRLNGRVAAIFRGSRLSQAL